MQTNANLPGVEKVVLCEVQRSWLQLDPMDLRADELGHPTLLGPGKVFTVKGWNRSVCFLTVLYACWKCPGLLEASLCMSFHISKQFGCWANTSFLWFCHQGNYVTQTKQNYSSANCLDEPLYGHPFDVSIKYRQVVPDEVKKILGWISIISGDPHLTSRDPRLTSRDPRFTSHDPHLTSGDPT